MTFVSTGFKLLVLPVSQYKTLKPTKPQPQVEFVENFVVVWLDQSLGKAKNSQTSKSQLQQMVNSVKIFMDPKECQAFISAIKDEKVFVIVSGVVGEKFVSSIHDKNQLESIYVLSQDKAKDETWFSQYPEIRGIYTTMLSLCEQLGKDVKKIDRHLLGFELIERSLPNTTPKANQQDALFMYDQLFRDIVLTVPDENMQDMYEFCENQYRGNSREQAFLKALKQKYSSHSPVW